MTNQINRRAFVASIPAVALLCGTVEAGQADPFLRAYNTWSASQRDWRDLGEKHDHHFTEEVQAELDAIWEVGDAALEVMANLKPESPAALAALAHVIWEYLGPQLLATSPDYDNEMASTDNKLMLNLYGALSGGKEMPNLY